MIFCKDRRKKQLKSSKIMRLTSQMPKLRKGRDYLLKYLTLMECTKISRITCLYLIKEGSRSNYKDLKIIKMMVSFSTTKGWILDSQLGFSIKTKTVLKVEQVLGLISNLLMIGKLVTSMMIFRVSKNRLMKWLSQMSCASPEISSCMVSKRAKLMMKMITCIILMLATWWPH